MAKIARAVVCCLLFVIVLPASAATYTVTHTGDSGGGSLREILGAVQNGDRIEFAIGSGPQRIQPLTPLPSPNGCVTFDGTTQPGYAGKPLIEIEGSLVIQDFSAGLYTCGTIQALAITNFRGYGIKARPEAGPTFIRGCFIGTVDGVSAKPNGAGIFVSTRGPNGVVIGGTDPGAGNLISGNYSGVRVWSDVPVVIQGNTFGSDLLRTTSLGTTNVHVGVENTRPSHVTIGDGAPNYFLGGGRGVEAFYSDGVVIDGNIFGIGASGVAIPGQVGIAFHMAGANVARNNVIANYSRAVLVSGTYIGNVISHNSIAKNGFGIDLESASYPFYHTANDPFDDDIGPNNLTNHPVITSASSLSGNTTIVGTLGAVPNRTYTIELFRSTTCSGSGYGEGEFFLDSFSVTTDGTGNASFTRNLAINVPAGQVITATATSGLEGTSEFSPCAVVEGNGAFSLQAANYVYEGNTLNITVRRTAGSAGAATVDWTAGGGSATAGTDYSPSSGTLSFASDETSKTITINTTDDAFFEGTETFNVTLSNPTGGATLGNPSTMAMSLYDNDPAPELVVTSPITVVEGDAGTKNVTIAIGLSGPAAVPIVASYNSNYWYNAYPGIDYVATSGTLTFAPGETQKTVTVTIIGDTDWEPDESFQLYVSHGYGSAYLTVIIKNDDPVPTISVENASVAETDNGTTVQVKFTAASNLYGYVYYSILPGTATPGVDYTHSGYYVYFNNQKSATINITILGDDEAEPDESFTVSIDYVPYPYGIGRKTATVFIRNDDTGVGPRDQMIPVGGTGSYMIDIGEPRQTPAVITLGSSDPEAVSVPASVTLPAGKSSVIFAARALKGGAFANISVKMPPELEGDEFTLRAYTFTPVNLVFQPERLMTYVGQTTNVRVKLDPAVGEPVIVALSADGGLEVPSRITINPGETASFTVKATKPGPAAVRARLPRDYGNREVVLFAEVLDTPDAPTILRISPPNGPAAGGTEVQIDGVAFTRDCTIAFGEAPAKSLRFLTSTLMSATTPPHDKGVVDVVLTCGELTSTFTSGFNFIDSAPQISHLEPSTGSTSGGTHVRIAGTDLRSSCWPFFDGIPAPVATIESASSMIAVTPPHAAGSIDVMLRCTEGDAVAGEAFLYAAGDDPAASILSVAPLAGAPGEEITINGTRFRPNDRFTFGTTAATLLRSGPDKQVVIVPELPAGRTSINLTDANGRLTTTGPIFAVLEATRPRITSISPQSAPAGSEIELAGEGFRAGYTFQIGGRTASIISSSYTRATVRLGSDLAPGRYEIQIINSASQLAAIGPAVTVTSDGLAIHSVSARCSATGGGEQLTITGRGFEGSMVVSFDTRLAGSATVADANTLVVTIPPGEAGPAQIRVTRADGATATLTNAFRYVSPFDPAGCSSGLRGGRAVRH